MAIRNKISSNYELFQLPSLLDDDGLTREKKILLLNRILSEAKSCIRELKKEPSSLVRAQALKQQYARLKLTQLQVDQLNSLLDLSNSSDQFVSKK